MKEVILHPLTRQQLESFLRQPRNALLLTGADGIGKQFTAYSLIAQLLGVSMHTINNSARVHIVSSDTAISIDAVRELQHFVKLKSHKTNSPIERAIIICDAHTMTIEAQNAFLKILEEPPLDTVIVMTSTGTHQLLSTIVSRAQHITIHKPASKDIVRHFENSFEMDKVLRAQHISNGHIGLMYHLLNDSDNQLNQAIQQAKGVYAKNTFERLIFVEEFIKTKQSPQLLITSLGIVGRAGLYQAIQKKNIRQIHYWLHAQKILLSAENGLQKNAHNKLLLSNVMAHL